VINRVIAVQVNEVCDHSTLQVVILWLVNVEAWFSSRQWRLLYCRS